VIEELTDGEALLRQIWESPEDPARLGVYADWLLEHDDPTRGEYIHLALLESPTAEQVGRRDALFRKHRTRWLGVARHHVRTWSDSERTPSFPSRVICTASQLASGYDLIRDLAPEVTVVVEHSYGYEQLLLALPLGQLYGLALELDDAFARVLARFAEQLDGLRRLELSVLTWRVTPETLTAALDRISTLEYLELAGGDDQHLRAIVDGPLGARLPTLVITEPVDHGLRGNALRRFRGRTLSFLPRD
jgi:uncharacterized protein (TIGR02996 family)